MPSAGLGNGAPLSLPAIVPLMGITPAPTEELTSATVRQIAVIKLILLMLFIILIFFLVWAFGDFSLLRTQFRPFTRVLRRIWPFVTQKVVWARCAVEAAVSAAKAKVIQECRRHACRYRHYLGAKEATIFSKRGSPRSGSQKGSSSNSPYVAPLGVRAESASCSNARSFSPTHAAIIAK